MKTSLLIVASLALGTAAIAQDTPPAAAPAGPETTAPAPSGSDPAAAPAPAPSDVTSPSPGAANPSSGATPDASAGGMSGGASGGNMAQAQQTASSTDTSSYPKCSRTVTDKCVSAGGMAHKRVARRHK